MSDITKQTLSDLIKNIKAKKLSSEEVTKDFILVSLFFLLKKKIINF